MPHGGRFSCGVAAVDAMSGFPYKYAQNITLRLVQTCPRLTMTWQPEKL